MCVLHSCYTYASNVGRLHMAQRAPGQEINLQTIRQALIRADDVNLRMLAPPRRITMRYEDLTAAEV